MGIRPDMVEFIRKPMRGLFCRLFLKTTRKCKMLCARQKVLVCVENLVSIKSTICTCFNIFFMLRMMLVYAFANELFRI